MGSNCRPFQIRHSRWTPWACYSSWAVVQCWPTSRWWTDSPSHQGSPYHCLSQSLSSDYQDTRLHRKKPADHYPSSHSVMSRTVRSVSSMIPSPRLRRRRPTGVETSGKFCHPGVWMNVLLMRQVSPSSWLEFPLLSACLARHPIPASLCNIRSRSRSGNICCSYKVPGERIRSIHSFGSLSLQESPTFH